MSELARRLIGEARVASLATIGADGRPFVSLIAVAPSGQGRLLTLLSGLAQHTKNLQQSADVSVLLTEQSAKDGDPLARARLTLTGTIGKIEKDGPGRNPFLARHFSLYEFASDHAHLVAGFGQIENIDVDQL